MLQSWIKQGMNALICPSSSVGTGLANRGAFSFQDIVTPHHVHHLGYPKGPRVEEF